MQKTQKRSEMQHARTSAEPHTAGIQEMQTDWSIWGPNLPKPTAGAAVLIIPAPELRERALSHIGLDIWGAKGLPGQAELSSKVFSTCEGPWSTDLLLTQRWTEND